MPRLLILAVVLCLLPQFALGVVKPPDEWFEEPGNAELWEQMWPTLNDWEFKPQPKVNGPGTDSYQTIVEHLGQPAGNVPATSEGLEEIGGVQHDLNSDGMIDHFDLLELGYEVRADTKGTSIAPPTGTNQILLLRADFQDQNANYANYNVAYFNDRMFSDDTAAKPSFRDYFQEVSYGQLDTQGYIGQSGPGGDGWFKGSQTKQWYIDNGGRWLVQEAVLAADDEIDYCDFDVDGDGYVDTLMLFYCNAVFSGGLWPHRSSGLNIHVDGVIVDSYFITGYNTGADSWTMVISAHEYGHILGLPDLYDVNGGSNGLGQWSLMAYNYNDNQKPPSPDPWCKCQLGWVEPEIVYDNVVGKQLPRYQDNPSVLRVWTNGQQEDQYFLLANYRQTGTDTDRPGQGLMIMHIDDSISGGNGDNSNHFRKHVDVESARGWQSGAGTVNAQDHLDVTSNGHSNDLWRSGNKDDFSDSSDVDALKYNNPSAPVSTGVRVHNISATLDTMTMDIVVGTATRPTCVIDAPIGGNVSANVQVDVTATPTAGRTINRVEFYCNGAFLGQDTSSPYSLTFDSRAIYDGSRTIKAVAVDNVGEIGVDTVGVDIGNDGVTLPYSDGFESGIGAWGNYNLGGDRLWRVTNGAGEASAGSNGVVLGGSSGGYDYNEHDEFVSVKLDLTGATHPICRYKQRYRVSGGENTVKVFITNDEGQTMTQLSSDTGTNLTWHPGAVDLLPWVGEEVRLVFRFDSSGLNRLTGNAGWWIDEVLVKELSQPPTVTGITPGDGSNVGGQVGIEVTATDDEAVATVEFYINGTDLVHIDNSSPFTYNWTSSWVFNGAHEFTAVASDEDAQSGSLTIDWNVSNTATALPWLEDFTAASLPSTWRIIDNNGNGDWHRVSTGGYNNTPGMYMGQTTIHDNLENDHLISPTFDLGTLEDPSLSFLHRWDIEATYDFARIFITTDLNTWSELDQWSSENAPWQSAGYLLDAWDDQQVKFNWFFESDVAVVEEGWRIDDTGVHSAPQIVSTSPSRIPRGTTPVVTITGTNFGDGTAIEVPKLTLGGVAITTLTWSDTEITFNVPAGQASANLVVERRGIAGDPHWLPVILPPPLIDDLNQKD